MYLREVRDAFLGHRTRLRHQTQTLILVLAFHLLRERFMMRNSALALLCRTFGAAQQGETIRVCDDSARNYEQVIKY